MSRIWLINFNCNILFAMLHAVILLLRIFGSLLLPDLPSVGTFIAMVTMLGNVDSLLINSNCFKPGKWPKQQLEKRSCAGSDFKCRLFYVTDLIIGTGFRIDTGAGDNVMPPTGNEKCHSSSLRLQAISKTSITTYGENSLTLDVGLCRIYHLIFTIF